jgi:hypothetical protein
LNLPGAVATRQCADTGIHSPFFLSEVFMTFSHWLLVAALVVQIYNVGTIWFVQIVVYPLFAKVGGAEYVTYHSDYTRRIPAVVIAPGFASFVLPVAVWWFLPDAVPLGLALVNIVMGLIGFLVTVGLEIPRHGRLERGGKQDGVIGELIRYNWPRTASITLSAAATLAMCFYAFTPV